MCGRRAIPLFASDARTAVASARTAVKDRSPLRGAPRVPRSASLTSSSLRLSSSYGGAIAPPGSVVPDGPFRKGRRMAKGEMKRSSKLATVIRSLGEAQPFSSALPVGNKVALWQPMGRPCCGSV